jgi:hypothetical protein
LADLGNLDVRLSFGQSQLNRLFLGQVGGIAQDSALGVLHDRVAALQRSLWRQQLKLGAQAIVLVGGGGVLASETGAQLLRVRGEPCTQ